MVGNASKEDMPGIEQDQTGLDGLRWRGTSQWNSDYGSVFLSAKCTKRSPQITKSISNWSAVCVRLPERICTFHAEYVPK